jgi:predicted DNA-binding transcriptional regulator YafY
MRCSPRVIDRVRLGWRFARLVDEDAPDAEGWVTGRFRADSIEVAVECALGLGADAEVIGPPDIADRVLAGAQAVVARAGRRVDLPA